MALIKCPECGGTVSSFADKCPHCGRPMEAVKVARKAKTKVVTEPQPEIQPEPQVVPEPVMEYQPIEEPVSEPQVQIEPEVAPQPTQAIPTTGISLGTIGKVLMIVFALVAIVFTAIMRTHAYEYNNEGGISLSRTFQDAAHGILYSLVALFFLVEMFRPSRSIVQRVLGFLLAGMALFNDVVPLLHLNHIEHIELFRAYQSISLIFGLFLMLYAATKQDWSKYVLLATGAMYLVANSYSRMDWVTDKGFDCISLPTVAFIALGSAFAVCVFIMLVWWLKEAATYGNKLSIKIPSLLMAMMIITSVIVVAVKLNDIMGANETTLTQRLDSVKFSLIFVFAATLSSLLCSLVCFKNKFLFVISALCVAISMYVLQGLNLEFSLNIAFENYSPSQDDFASINRNTVNFGYTAFFLMSTFIILNYVAELTKGLTNKISHK